MNKKLAWTNKINLKTELEFQINITRQEIGDIMKIKNKNDELSKDDLLKFLRKLYPTSK